MPFTAAAGLLGSSGLGKGIGDALGGSLMGTPKSYQVTTPWEKTVEQLIQSGTSDTATTQQLQELLKQMQTVRQEQEQVEKQVSQEQQTSQQNQSQSTTGTNYGQTSNNSLENTSQNQNQQTATDQQTTGTQSTQNLTDAERGGLNDLIANLSGQLGGNSQFSQANAEQAGNDAMGAAIDRVMQTGIGDVAASGVNAGAYNSTAQGGLASRLGADATRAGMEAMTGVKAQYGQLQNQEQGQLTNALSQLFGQLNAAGGTTTTDQTSKTLQDMLAQLTGTVGKSDKGMSSNVTSGTSDTNVTGQTNTTGSKDTSTNTSSTSETESESSKDQSMQGSQSTDTTQTSDNTSETDREFDKIKTGGKSGLLSGIGKKLGF